MNKRIALAVIALLVVTNLGLVGCAQKEETAGEETNATVSEKTLTVSEALEKIKAAELETGVEIDAYASMISAKEGKKIQVNGKVLEAYHFDSADKQEKSKENFDQEKGTIFEQNGLMFYITTTETDLIDKIKTALNQ